MPNPARQRGRQVNAFQALALLLTFALVAGVSGVLAAGLVLPGVAVANGVTDITVTAFDDLPTELDQKELPEKSVIKAADGTLLATFWTQNRVVVPLTEIAPLLQQAVVATEDKRFYKHVGVDPTGMLRAFVKNQTDEDGGQEGASTLTQQYIKNVLIEEALSKETEAEKLAALQDARGASGTEGYARKLREAKLAIALEKTMTKEQILEKYLNIAPFGASVYGAESAAQYYFTKPAKDLNYLEAATIAGVTQSPTKWDPVLNPEASQTRRDRVLKLMNEQGFITDEEYAAGVATPLPDTLHVTPLKQGCMAAGDVIAGSGYFCDFVTKIIANDEAFGATRDERIGLLYQGGLTITTTLDPGMQRLADAEVKAGIPVDDPSGVASAIVTVQPGTGKVLSMAQNRTYAAAATPGTREESVNFNTDGAYGGSGGFAPGSTFKPLTLLEWLKQGHSLYEQVNGTARTMNENMFTTCGAKGGNVPWPVRNSEGGAGMMTVLQGTQQSVNLAYVTMASQLDMCNIMKGAEALGVHTAKPKPDGTTTPSVNPSNVLGTDSVAPLTMASAFATFASGGIYCKPIAITSVQNAQGEELPIPPANCTQAVETKYANTVTFALSNVWKGTASKVGAPPFPSAGKTGTTTNNEDTWFVGYTPLLATAVWVGFSEAPRPVQDMTVNGRWVPNAYGSTIAAPTWKRFMTQVLAGAENPGFGAPDDKLVFGEKVPVPSVVGKSEADARATLQRAGFNAAVDPTQVPSTLPAGTVAAQNPSGTATRGTSVVLTLSNGQPPAGPDPNQPGLPGWPGNGNGGGNGGGGGGGPKP
ncbi:transglycosylase domain-containing protein [Cellulomonas sp. Leaf334]|uniref:penicillin-binding protein n=1 Tax=Cellulomonas sp. Leaf334 TaxID=1736339 RepID=UPI0006F6D762|nr:transglycosylase domain-containing protein [Cellulomonas sp. Leaf334]KQR08478.1 glycosyl transferase [Cellulomonas sp. Leaf334]